MDSERQYARTWRILRGLVNGIFCKIYAYEYQPVQSAAKACLVVANHNTDLDPVLVGLAFRRPMRFVASEHVFRKGIASWLLRKVFNPISRIKGSTDASAALGMIRSLRKGENVCMFAEGNRSFSGVTGPIAATVGKLIKSSGATLITFKLEGGYLTTPRWSKTLRRGRMRGYCVHEYSPEELSDMTAEAVNAAVATDLFEDETTSLEVRM